MSHADDVGSAHPDEGALAAFLDGQLSDDEAAQIVRHLDTCRDCRVHVGGTARVMAEYESSDRRPSTAPAAHMRRMPVGAAIAIVASLAVVFLSRRDVPPSSGVVRTSTPSVAPGEGLATIAVHTPVDGDSVRGAGLTFSWAPSTAERYRLVVANEEGTPVWRVDTKDTIMTLPDSVVLRSGAPYFWHVDAVHAGVTATTRLQRFTAMP